MHYEEMAARLEEAHEDDVEAVFENLAAALRDGQGYVLIILDPSGIKTIPAVVPGNSGATVNAKTTMRKIVQRVQSGRAHGPSS